MVLGSLALALVGCGSNSDDKGDADGGTGNGGEMLTEPLDLGDPITAPDNEWTWVDFPETRCMNDTPTGLGIKLNKSSDKLIVVIQGGGACFNQATCLTVINQNGFGASSLMANVNKGLLDANDVDNPFADWNMVFIPYCSGDTFTGNAVNKTGYGGTRTQTGHINFREYLKRLVPTFPKSSHVVISGYSAGGFAATFNWLEAREAWGEDMKVDVLNDSGPPMGPKYLTPCLQQRMAMAWNWTDSVPKGCKECDIASGNVTEPALKWALQYTKKGRHALISSDQDGTIKQFFGFGQDDCKSLDAFGGYFPMDLYPMGLADLQATFMGNPGSHAFIISSNTHVWTLQSPGKVMSEGVVLRDWIKDFLDPSSDWQDVVPK
jgi:hypothetical protein